ncbi:MAG: hypothetical protein JXX28_05510, partial [Deltaproteobacteria bacterium]|nr:hypothetical protein [Deltaproteobacteria bacterium]
HEGFVHFYSALAFNDNSSTSSDCWFAPYRQVDWNQDGSFGTTEADCCGSDSECLAANAWSQDQQCYVATYEPNDDQRQPPYRPEKTGSASCEGTPIPYYDDPPELYVNGTNLYGANDHLSYCSALSPSAPYALTDHHGTPYDWMRFFWDMNTNAQIPLSELLEIYGEATPATWITTETGLWWQQGAYPAARLQNAAEDHGYLAWWHLYGNMNGVHTDPVSGGN